MKNRITPHDHAVVDDLLFILFVVLVIGIVSWLFLGKADAQEVNLDKIAMIESGGNPLAYNFKSHATGMYQITQSVIDTFNNEMIACHKIDPSCGVFMQLTDMYEPKYAYDMAEWFLNREIPQWLNNYGIPDTITNRLIAYNWGIGHLRKWFKHGSHWNKLPKETRNYIKKYQGDL